jgi:protein tyrosine phosphatase
MYQFREWPDHGVPTSTAPFLAFMDVVNKRRDQRFDKPLLIHCTAGVGRTGAYFAVDYCLHQYREQSCINVVEVVVGARRARCGIIQKTVQFEFVLKSLFNYVEKN